MSHQTNKNSDTYKNPALAGKCFNYQGQMTPQNVPQATKDAAAKRNTEVANSAKSKLDYTEEAVVNGSATEEYTAWLKAQMLQCGEDC